MGTGTSLAEDERHDSAAPRSEYREFGQTLDDMEEDEGPSLFRASLVKMAFSGVWSIEMPKGRSPAARSGHFTIYSSEFRSVFIGFGVKRNGSYLSDVWAFNIDDRDWHKLRLSGDTVKPREGIAATMMGNYIVCFGGFADPDYSNELFTIDVTTGEVFVAETTGQLPFPQRDSVIGIYKRKLFLWSGYNGEDAIRELQVLSFDTMVWELKPVRVDGSPGITWTQIGPSVIIAYGGVENEIVRLDMKRECVTRTESCGAAPPANVHHAGMVRAGDYLIFLGGNCGKKWTMVYANCMSKNWWFVMFVTPDGETTSEADGKISSDGIFLLPKIDSFSLAYVEERREIVAFLGRPQKSPAPTFVLYIGDALALCHLREDMADMFEMMTEFDN